MTKTTLLATAASAALLVATSTASAQELRFQCYQDGAECDTLDALLDEFEAANEGITVTVDIVPYQAILESLPVQLASGEGPDMARVTDLGGLAQYMLDISPYVDTAYWEENYGPTLSWTRVGDNSEDGIYSLSDQLTATGPYVNATLFEQAGVEIPGEGATYEDWAAAASQVAEATGVDFPMAVDRSGHRYMGPAISYGAKLFGEDGEPLTVDEGFKAWTDQFVAWNEDGTMAEDVWAGAGGSTYQDAAAEFINGGLVYYLSGSWQIGRFGRDIGDAFDWQAVPPACGPAGVCTGIPGGAAIVGFEITEHPEAVAKVMDYLASEDVMRQYAAKTKNIPSHRGLQEAGIEYEDATDAEKAALATFSKALLNFSPTAFDFQGYKNNRAMMNATVARVTQAIVGESSVDEALGRVDEDVKEAVTAAQ